MRNVEHVVAALTTPLAAADIDDGRADEGALADAARGIAAQAGCARHQPDIDLDRQVLEEVHVARLAPLAQLSNAPGNGPRAGIGIRPQPDRWQLNLAHRVQRRHDLLLAGTVFRRYGMLRDEQKGLHQVEPIADAKIENAFIGRRGARAKDLGDEGDARTADEMDVLRPFAEPNYALARAGAGRGMKMSEFCDCVAHALVDPARD